jgi:hypothetical protein
MKKVLLSVAVAATFVFASCGGPSICDCVKAFENMEKEVEEAGEDEAKIKAVEEKYKSQEEACKKLGEEMEKASEEEQKKMMEEMMNCK